MAKRLTAAQQQMKEAVAYLQKYMATYDKQYGYLDYRTETLIDDVLYGLGAALNADYQYADGFRKFKARLVEAYQRTDEPAKS